MLLTQCRTPLTLPDASRLASTSGAPDIRPGYRNLAAKSHTLYYRPTDEGVIDIIRILHQRMDLDHHL
ncbi:type II toxin-antitoxin system RelE/ParE family toxin [Nocardia sp. NPDC047038]|uniref:type II toxin-antitoxin system RelE/ParE family toxin n=1 Tax=Nocardia sp. NPDC047038 TaxID=3154338 RepID=UPI0033F2F3B9